MADTFFRNADSRIFYENPSITRFFIFFITESDKAATGELGSIINKVIDYLLQADIICRKIFLVRPQAYAVPVLRPQAYSGAANHGQF